MKTLFRIAASSLALLVSSSAQEIPASAAGGSPEITATQWSLVYLPDLEWTEAEVRQTLALLQQLKPDLVVSMAPCPFGEKIRNLECKPTVLDQTQRAKLGAACGLPANPWSQLEDTSTLPETWRPRLRERQVDVSHRFAAPPFMVGALVSTDSAPYQRTDTAGI